jgi:hypothetical protein
MSTSNEAAILAVLGQTGQGKGVYVKAITYRDPPARALIWDAMDEWGEFAPAMPTMTHIANAIVRRGSAGAFRYRYIPKGAAYGDAIKREFDAFCLIALAAQNCTVIVEELSFVTEPGWAPAGWAKATSAGRHKGLRLIFVSQAPQDCDKRALRNATEIVTLFLGDEPARRTVATAMDIDPAQIKALPQFHFLRFTRSTRTVQPGCIAPPGRHVAATGTPTATEYATPSQTPPAAPKCAA